MSAPSGEPRHKTRTALDKIQVNNLAIFLILDGSSERVALHMIYAEEKRKKNPSPWVIFQRTIFSFGWSLFDFLFILYILLIQGLLRNIHHELVVVMITYA